MPPHKIPNNSVPETEEGYLTRCDNILEIQQNLHPGPGVVPLKSIPGEWSEEAMNWRIKFIVPAKLTA